MVDEYPILEELEEQNMELKKSLLITKFVVSGSNSIANFKLSFPAAKKRTVYFIASGLVKPESGIADNSRFVTGFHHTETNNVWSATYRSLNPGADFANFAISGEITLSFKELHIYWRARASNSAMRVDYGTLLLGVSEPVGQIEKSHKNLDDLGMPISSF